MSIRGVTFPNQTVAAVDHGVLFERAFSDGIIKGCAVTFTGSTITIGAGYLIVAGRLIQNTADATITAAASGSFARLKVVIDTTLPSTTSSFQQVSFSLDYAASASGFSALTQDDINAGTGNTYEAALCIFSMSGPSVSAIVSGPFNANLAADTAASATTATTATTATKANQLVTARNIGITDADGSNAGTAASFNGTSAVTIKLPATIKATIVGALSGLAATATKLATARTIRTNLASTSTASFDGTANITPGVTGTLGAANGGTGQTTLQDAMYALCNSIPQWSSAPADTDYYLSQYGSGTTVYQRRPVTQLAAYVLGKITASNIPELAASKITSGTFAAARIPNLAASKVTSGTFDAARIPALDASKITGGSSTLAAFTGRRIYMGTAAPGSSVGSQGDVYIVYS